VKNLFFGGLLAFIVVEGIWFWLGIVRAKRLHKDEVDRNIYQIDWNIRIIATNVVILGLATLFRAYLILR